MFDNIAPVKKGSFAHKLKENHLKKEVFLRNIIENCLHEKTKSEERMILIGKKAKNKYLYGINEGSFSLFLSCESPTPSNMSIFLSVLQMFILKYER